MGRTITQRRRFAAFVYGVMSLCLFGEAAELIQQEYRIANESSRDRSHRTNMD